MLQRGPLTSPCRACVCVYRCICVMTYPEDGAVLGGVPLELLYGQPLHLLQAHLHHTPHTPTLRTATDRPFSTVSLLCAT